MRSNHLSAVVAGALFAGVLSYLGGAALAGAGGNDGPASGTATLSNGASVEFGTVPVGLRSSTFARTTITFKNKYKTPPLVFVQQGGRAGTFLALRVEKLTTETAEVVAHTVFEKMPLVYNTELVYLAVGEPVSGG